MIIARLLMVIALRYIINYTVKQYDKLYSILHYVICPVVRL